MNQVWFDDQGLKKLFGFVENLPKVMQRKHKLSSEPQG